MADDGPTRVQRRESSAELRWRARELRQVRNAAEARLWRALRGRQLDGLKFRRQRAIGPYIADFLCVDRNLVVEVDGPVHDDPDARERDAMRDAWMEARGLRVVRLSSTTVMRNLDSALAQIRIAIGSIDDPPATAIPYSPLPSRRERGRG